MIFGFNFSELFLLGCFPFGVGYAIGHARNFGCFKFIISFLALIPFYSTFLENQKDIALVIAAFLCGLFSVFIAEGEGPRLQIPFRRFFWNLRRGKPRNEGFSERRQPEESRGPRSGPQNDGGERSGFEESRQRREEAERARRNAKADEKGKTSQSERERRGRKSEDYPKDDIQSKKDVDDRTPYEILGLQSGASHEEIVKAYREKVKALHPDRWILMPPHLRKELEEEMKKINGAYEKLKS